MKLRKPISFQCPGWAPAPPSPADGVEGERKHVRAVRAVEAVRGEVVCDCSICQRATL